MTTLGRQILITHTGQGNFPGDEIGQKWILKDTADGQHLAMSDLFRCMDGPPS